MDSPIRSCQKTDCGYAVRPSVTRSLAVSVNANVYCSTMEGIFELSANGQRRQIVPAPRQLITNLAANSKQLAFVSDAGAQGKDQLVVYTVPR